MKKISVMCGMLTAIVIMTVAVFAQEEKKTVDVMFLHDTHSYLNEFATVEDGESQVLGGFARIKTLINEQKEDNPDTLLLDAGDFSMGTLVQVVYEEEAAELRMLGELGMDVTTLGNHEFDYKAEGLANMLDRAEKSGDPLPEIVVCNIDWAGMEAIGLTDDQKLLKEAFEQYGIKEYTVTEKNGVKIAVTGVFGKDCLGCVADCPLLFSDPIEAVAATAERIKAAEDADMIVCVSHGGTMENKKKSEDELLAKAVPMLDLIISGHTHTKLEEPIVHGSTYIVAAEEYGKYLGSLTMAQTENGRWKMDSYELIKVDQSIEPDPETQKKAEELEGMADELYLEQFGYTKDQVLCTNDITFSTTTDASLLHTEQNMGSLITDAYTYAVEKFSDSPFPVAAAFIPGGMIRGSYAQGTVTTEDVFNSFSLGMGPDGIPGYPLISVYLTGAELKIVAEIDASISPLMPSARLYSDGLYWHFNPNRMILNKVTDVYICDNREQRVELEDDMCYRVVTDLYTAKMLGGVTDLSYGLLSVVAKHADGTPVERYEDAIVMKGDQELKAWTAIADYMCSFEDTDGDGIGEVPEKYASPEGRKVVEDSWRLQDLLKQPNKFFFMIIGIAAVIVCIVILAVIFVKKAVICIRKKRKVGNY